MLWPFWLARVLRCSPRNCWRTIRPATVFWLDEGWKFHLDDDWPGGLRFVKAGGAKGADVVQFNDAAWCVLNLPYDCEASAVTVCQGSGTP